MARLGRNWSKTVVGAEGVQARFWQPRGAFGGGDRGERRRRARRLRQHARGEILMLHLGVFNRRINGSNGGELNARRKKSELATWGRLVSGKRSEGRVH